MKNEAIREFRFCVLHTEEEEKTGKLTTSGRVSQHQHGREESQEVRNRLTTQLGCSSVLLRQAEDQGQAWCCVRCKRCGVRVHTRSNCKVWGGGKEEKQCHSTYYTHECSSCIHFTPFSICHRERHTTVTIRQPLTSQEVRSLLHHPAPQYQTRLGSVWG